MEKGRWLLGGEALANFQCRKADILGPRPAAGIVTSPLITILWNLVNAATTPGRPEWNTVRQWATSQLYDDWPFSDY